MAGDICVRGVGLSVRDLMSMGVLSCHQFCSHTCLYIVNLNTEKMFYKFG